MANERETNQELASTGAPEQKPMSASELEREKLSLERYKAQLDYKKFLAGSVAAAIAIAAIPPLFQLASALVEYVKSQKQLASEQEKFREEYVKSFMDNALKQDIELRIRMAEYFSHVSAESYRPGFVQYRDDLRTLRDEARKKINGWEKEWRQKAPTKPKDDPELDELRRNLTWAYNEVGYVEPNRSVIADPRAPAPDPTRKATDLTYFLAGMKIDADGDCDKGCDAFPGRASQTSYKQPDTKKSLDPSNIPFIALPLVQARESDLLLGDFAAVYNTANKKWAYAIFGDITTSRILVEGSIALAKDLGITPMPDAGVDGGIVYIVFPRSRVDKPVTHDLIVSEGKKLLERWGGEAELQRRLQPPVARK